MPKLTAPVCAAVVTLGAALLGCGEAMDASSTADIETAQGDIIGGTVISAATRRSMGLIDFATTTGGCSGSLLTPDWVLTARHCVDFVTPSNNMASAVRADGGLDMRRGAKTVVVGTTELALVKLAPGPATWPSVTRTLPTSAPQSLVGQNITCYGHGVSGYASPSGLLNDGKWRQLTKTVAQYDETPNIFYIAATSTGQEIVAFGDSGGACFFNNQPVATVWGGATECADNSSPTACSQTITKIPYAWLSVVSPRTTYIRETLNNRVTASFLPLTLVNGWTPAPYTTDYPSVAVVGGTVHLRGGLSSGTASKIFTLPLGARPSHVVYVPTNLFSGAKGRLIISTNGDVEVQAEGEFSDATLYTSLDGVSFELTTTGHLAMTLQNGWQNTPYGTRPVAAGASNGIVRFEGAMSTATESTSPFVVPAALRPATRVYLPIDLCGALKGRLIIEPTGSVTVSAETSFPAAKCFTSLEGAFYPQNANGFQTLTPLNGWVGAGYATRAPAVRNDGGVAVFEGSIASGTGAQAFLLPERFRPATDVYVDADLCNAKKGRLYIKPTGEIIVQSKGSFTDATCFTSLESVQFGI